MKLREKKKISDVVEILSSNGIEFSIFSVNSHYYLDEDEVLEFLEDPILYETKCHGFETKQEYVDWANKVAER